MLFHNIPSGIFSQLLINKTHQRKKNSSILFSSSSSSAHYHFLVFTFSNTAVYWVSAIIITFYALLYLNFLKIICKLWKWRRMHEWKKNYLHEHINFLCTTIFHHAYRSFFFLLASHHKNYGKYVINNHMHFSRWMSHDHFFNRRSYLATYHLKKLFYHDIDMVHSRVSTLAEIRKWTLQLAKMAMTFIPFELAW